MGHKVDGIGSKLLNSSSQQGHRGRGFGAAVQVVAFARGREDADCSIGAVGAVLLGRARTLQVLGAVRD